MRNKPRLRWRYSFGNRPHHRIIVLSHDSTADANSIARKQDWQFAFFKVMLPLYGECSRAAFVGEFEIVPMSTVIFRSYTKDGFVVGSDGLVRNSDNGAVASENEQKIFCFSDLRSLSFSFVGSVDLGSRDRVVFSFPQAFSVAVASIKNRGYQSLMDYAKEISRPVLSVLRELRSRGYVRFDAQENSREPDGRFPIADILIDGYFGGVPQRVEICFSHLNQHVRANARDLRITTQDIVHGSTIVTNAFHSSEAFRKYRTAAVDAAHTSRALSEAIRRAKGMIEAQGSDEARRLDEHCYGMGGRIQIATITQEDGFQWVRGYEPL